MRQRMRVLRLVLVLVLLAWIAGPAWARFQPESCKNSFTEQQEIAEGSKVAAEVFKQMPVLPDSSPVSQYVRQLGAKLVAVAPGYKWPYNFHVWRARRSTRLRCRVARCL
jgi:predicted Zn-dependent protease